MAFNIDSASDASGGTGELGTTHRIGSSLAEINVIPFVDVVLVLLLIFMLTAPMMYRGIDVNLPKTSASTKPAEMEERMILTLSKDQIIYLNEKPIPLEQLDLRLRTVFSQRKDKTLYLKADRTLSYGFVVETMDKIKGAGVEKLGMVTEPAPPERKSFQNQ